MKRKYRKGNPFGKPVTRGRKKRRARDSNKVTSKIVELCPFALPQRRDELLALLEDQLHKKRNVEAHTPAQHQAEVRRQMNEAFAERDYDEALSKLNAAARWLSRISPDAAASLREGLEETLTVIRLGVDGVLRQTLSTTNPIESAFDTTRTVTSRVKRWREGDMRRRWCIAGLLKAEKGFRRVRGYKQIPKLASRLKAAILDKRSKAG